MFQKEKLKNCVHLFIDFRRSSQSVVHNNIADDLKPRPVIEGNFFTDFSVELVQVF